MNISIFIGGLGTGGAERVVCNLSNFLSQRHNVTIITVGDVTSSYKLNSDVQHISLSENLNNNHFVVKNIKRIIKLNKIVKNQSQDIFLSFLPVPSFMLLFLRKKIKVPIIVSVRNDPKIEYASKIFNVLMRFLYPRADGFVFQTEEAKNYFNIIKIKTSEVIPNPINEDFINQCFTGDRKKKIVAVGRLTQQKNHMLLIDAFAQVADKHSEYKLIIYGEGPLRFELKNRIKELKMEDKIQLPGNVNNIKDHIIDATLFVLSSNYEGMPNALMEAMALGIPVISTDCPCGGPKYLIKNNQNGLLVPVNDCYQMSAAIEKVLSNNDYSRVIGKEAAQIAKELNPRNIYEKWEKYITDSIK